MDNIGIVFSITLMYATPLIFAALGGIISERSGVTNIGIEGMMTIGAFAGAAVGYFTANPWIGFACAAAAGGALSALHAIACVKFHANQIISGVALNLIGLGVSLFLSRLLFDGVTQTLPVPNKLPKLVENGPGGLNLDSTVLVVLIFIIGVWFFLYKSRGGLRLIAVGEHPAAADTLGVNVFRVRFLAVIVSGLFAGMGGAARTLAVVSSFSPIVISGHGYIALAAVIFGRWNPVGASLACLLFGFAQSLVVVLGGGDIAIPSQILAMLPYILTIVVLVLLRGKTNAPKASGIPYIKGQR
ncbi:ABC transporter permease [Christensenellaceae bacterium OttesenSCG-928-K19]|nr:ABC transporter permease [Christensenellaceae bacterium OttesenSCG-928-K19]